MYILANYAQNYIFIMILITFVRKKNHNYKVIYEFANQFKHFCNILIDNCFVINKS